MRILSADRLSDGVVIAFADGTSALYRPEFLYEHRDRDGNHTVIEDPEVTDEPLDSA
jgi:hypothetical protein